MIQQTVQLFKAVIVVLFRIFFIVVPIKKFFYEIRSFEMH